MSRSTATAPTSALARGWQRWRFHLNVLLVLIPLGFMPRYFEDMALFRGDIGLGQGEERTLQVGPYRVRIVETLLATPESEGRAGYYKLISAALCDGCETRIRASYVRIGEPRSLRTAGAIFFGSPYRMLANVAMPNRAVADAQLWVTLEEWDGTLHQAHLPLAEVSSISADWLAQRPTKE